MNAIFFNEDDNGINPTVGEIPAELADDAEIYRQELIEVASEADDELMMKVLEDEPVTIDEIKAALRKACIANACTPIVCGASFKNKGVQPLLDAVVDFLPSPLDVPAIMGIDLKTDEEVPRPVRRQGAVRRARLQGHDRPVRRQADLLPRLLGHAELGLLRPELDEGPQGAHRSPAADARQPPRGHRRRLGWRHRGRRRPQEHHHRRHAVRRRRAGAARVHGLPGPGHRHRHRAQDQGRAGQARRRPARSSPRRTRPSASARTRRPVRPSSPAWASCTSRSSSTA